MADRIEYQGVPLPSGLPGFGGGTVEVLTLPGFNTVVAPLKFGPVVDAINAVPPDPTPPTGSNPDDPTDQVVPPGPPPQSGTSPTFPPNFCQECVQSEDYGQNPMLMGYRQTISCVPCGQQTAQNIPYYTSLPAAESSSRGIFWAGAASIEGFANNKTWSISETELNLDSSAVSLNKSQLALGVGEALETFYQAGPTIKGPDGKEYTPQSLQVCVGGQTKTWYVLAYEQ